MLLKQTYVVVALLSSKFTICSKLTSRYQNMLALNKHLKSKHERRWSENWQIRNGKIPNMAKRMDHASTMFNSWRKVLIFLIHICPAFSSPNWLHDDNKIINVTTLGTTSSYTILLNETNTCLTWSICVWSLIAVQYSKGYYHAPKVYQTPVLLLQESHNLFTCPQAQCQAHYM